MLIKFPISIYLGWVTIATVANVTALLVTINWNGFGLSPMWWTIIVIAVHEIINSLVSISKQDIWFASHYEIWDTFKATGECKETKVKPVNKSEAAAISVTKTIQPGETKIFTYYFTWYFPNVYKYWEGWDFTKGQNYADKPHWKNYYATVYKDAWDVALKVHQYETEYYRKSKLFHDALYGSTIPSYVKDAISANMALLKTTTCLRLEDGTFYGWEGCHPDSGCCEGTCMHVWGYEQTTPFLFPSLERSVRETNYEYNFLFDDEEDLIGIMEFRIQLPMGSGHAWSGALCADGQLGQVMHTYREWKVCGDNEWLKKIWERVKKSLEFAWEEHDEEKTGVLRSAQHNTYDIEFWGPNSMLTSYYLGALHAASEMAETVGDLDSAKEYKEIAERGAEWIDDNLFKEDYGFYIQQIPEGRPTVNQVQDGCLIDQVLGQQLARIAGLPNFLNQKNVRSALLSIFNHNWLPNMREHENGARLYAVNDEAAVVLATWPYGGRPEIPFPYADEVMNGFEYQFGAHCIMEGLIEEGLTVCKSIRDRYDGWGRNPWNEFECGHHYARSMAAYGYLIALSGFKFDKGKGILGFDPKIRKENFTTFWALDGVWGIYSQKGTAVELEILYGSITLKSLNLPVLSGKVDLTLKTSEKTMIVSCNDESIVELKDTIELKEGEILSIQ